MRFNKNQIDGICKDIRYPNEFFVDLILDEEQARPLSNYEEDVSKWKAILSEFILKGYKQNDISSSDGGVDMKLKENPRNKDIPSDDVSNMTSISSYDLEKDEDFSNKPSTLLTAHEILQKFNRAESHSNQDTSKGGEDEEENEEEDIEEYLKSLENKTN